MGKNKGKSKKPSNVFKVAGAQSLKVKNKAKKFTGQIKKLNEGTRKQTLQVDGQLASLHTTLLKKPSSVNDRGASAIADLKKIHEVNSVNAEKLEKNKDDIIKLSNMSVS